MRATRLGAVLAATLTATLTIGGCGSSEPAGGSEAAAQSPAAPQGPVTLTYWTWAPNMDKIVEVWNKDHPDIQITVSKQAGGDDAAAKFLTSAKAGNLPDLVQAEYQHLPSFIAADAVADLKAETTAIKGEFGEGVWGLVTLGTEAVYAVPQDSGPMMLFYRKDLFDKYGLRVPKTWQEYGEAARTLRKKVADFWGGLVKEGAIDDTPFFTPEWNKALNDGKLLTWPSAVWAPGVLSSNAPKAEGKWAVAPLLQWNAGESFSGFWGGSSVAASAKTPHKAAAARFATWPNTDPKALDLLVKEAAIYPAAAKAQSALGEAPAYFAGQPNFWQQAATVSAGARGFTFGPNVGVTYNAFKDGFDKALQDGTSFSDAVQAMHEATVADMLKSGFTLAS